MPTEENKTEGCVHCAQVENLLNQTILYSFGKVRNVYLNEEKDITYTD